MVALMPVHGLSSARSNRNRALSTYPAWPLVVPTRPRTIQSLFKPNDSALAMASIAANASRDQGGDRSGQHCQPIAPNRWTLTVKSPAPGAQVTHNWTLAEKIEHGRPRCLCGFGLIAEPPEFGTLGQVPHIKAMTGVGV